MADAATEISAYTAVDVPLLQCAMCGLAAASTAAELSASEAAADTSSAV